MTEGRVLAEIAQIITQKFEYAEEVTYDTVADDVDGWDSVAHVELILEVEERFGIRLTTGEMAALHDVGALVAAVQKHIDCASGEKEAF